ncbi:MAG TPA: hypothetical protein HPP80_07045, partial [Rhodospirillaceae bacterium]|nr:hypothetical protein [Rhodospirillaceae bacterium]
MQDNSKDSAPPALSGPSKLRRNARNFVEALTARLSELESVAKEAKSYNVFTPSGYAGFKTLFNRFRELSEEFQLLSQLAEDSLTKCDWTDRQNAGEYKELEVYFRRLQVPMLHAMITTNLRLLRVWDDRLRQGEGLPLGSRELFVETVRLIYNARLQLLRPRYIELLDDAAIQDAERADRLLRTLIRNAPGLFDFDIGHISSDHAAGDDDEFLQHCSETFRL